MRNKKLSSLTKGLILLGVIIAVGVGLVFWKSRVGHAAPEYNVLTKEEIAILVSDIATQNPKAVRRLKEDPELRKQQLENIKQLLAFASQAQREGLANESPYREELGYIRQQIIAALYDREINKDKGPMPQFGFIDENRVKAFWGENGSEQKSFFENLKQKLRIGFRDRELEFEKFLNTKIALLKEQNPQLKDREISDDERKQARDVFAKFQIYYEEYEDKVRAGQISKEIQDKINLQVKLQQAQFLAGLYAEKVKDKLKVTDEEIAKYIAEHPELDPATKRAKAQEILERAKKGEDFATLANEFTDDPGNSPNLDGKKRGGLYENVRTGQMIKQFEDAALALKPGEIAPNLVETDYGFHIIKLESKKEEPAEKDGKPTTTYNVRHILISTAVKDPNSPLGGTIQLKQYVEDQLEKQKRDELIEKLVAENHVEVPDDFDLPDITDQQIQESMSNQLAMPDDEFHSEGKNSKTRNLSDKSKSAKSKEKNPPPAKKRP
ncbi:MAG: hypothetical protein C4325_01635 [Blastocatellia bacterium]